VHGDQVDVVSAELAESDAKAGVKYRYHITQRGAA